MAGRSRQEKQIAVVVYPGLTTLELIGTVSALDGLGLNTSLKPVTVGKSRAPVSPNTPMRLVPQRTFEEVTRPFGLLVPGGGPNAIASMGDETLLRYVRSAAKSANLVASVGTGSLVLAAAGLLDGKRATIPRPTARSWRTSAPSTSRRVGSRTASSSPQAAPRAGWIWGCTWLRSTATGARRRPWPRPC